LTGEIGERLRERGREYGATTGRPRRCGWLDLIALAYAVRLNGVTGLAVTKLDVLDGMEELRVCTGYRIGETVQESWPVNPNRLREVDPRCETLPGWKANTEGAKRVEDLPGEARSYLDRISESLGVPLDVVSTGPDRGQEVWFRHPW